MKIKPDIPVVYEGRFPSDFVNDLDGWNFSREKLTEKRGKILTIDLDFGLRCSLNCPHCFRRNSNIDTLRKEMLTYEEILSVIKEAKELGLESMKFLGAGEPFEADKFLDFLRFLKKMKVKPLIFTKGHVIGDDNLVKKYYSQYGITTGKQLIDELKKCDVRILLGFNSFDTKIQDKMVGGIKGYTLKRNRALELLVKAGFSKHNPTHLCLAMNPVTNINYDEMFEMYTWARERNLYAIVTPSMIGGRCAEEQDWRKITPTEDKLVELYIKIYKFNIERGIQTLEEIKRDGISSYAGGVPCHQMACGMYIALNGTVLRCPGDDITIFGNIREKSLKEIWIESENYKKWAGTYNYGCPPKDGKSIPHNFYARVISNLEKNL